MVELRRGVRQAASGGGGGKRKYPDHRAHADELSAQAVEVVTEQLKRPGRFDLDPKLILVVELNRDVPTDTWRSADLVELDAAAESSVIAFASDPQLKGFLERLARHRDSSPTSKDNLYAADLFDALVNVRRYDASDRISPRLREAVDGTSPDDELLLDLEIWHPGDDADLADAWRSGVASAIATSGGTVLDSYTDHSHGLVLLRVLVPSASVNAVAELDEIATLDLPPQAPSIVHEALELSVADLPDLTSPAQDAPLVGMVDSGVNASHPLLSPALYETTSLLPEFQDGSDEHGHGTAVAGVLLHGPAEDWLVSGVLPRPSARLLSIRVLDSDNLFPQGVLWENAVIQAIRHAASLGARVINLSIGDPTTPQERRRATPVAAVLDGLARELNLVILVPTGNVAPADYTTNDRKGADDFIAKSLEASTSTLIDPAGAALALTVGGLGQSVTLPKVGEVTLGGDHEPSGISRRGPGVGRGIKPDVVAPSGTLAWSPSLGFVDRPRQLGRVLCSHDPDALFRTDTGTSFAVPIVSHIASAIVAENPGIQQSALVRALVLQSAKAKLIEEKLPAGTSAKQLRHRLDVSGHGQPVLRDAVASSSNRVVLVAEGRLPVDFVAVFEVPLPQSFFETGGKRRMTLSVCFDPVTRYRRLDYLGSRFYPYMFHGAEADEIADTLIKADEGFLAKGNLGSLGKSRLDLQPSATASSESANIVGCWKRSRRMDAEKGDSAFVAIRSIRRWAPESTQDSFGVALALEHEGADIDLHAELAARIRVPVELTVSA